MFYRSVLFEFEWNMVGGFDLVLFVFRESFETKET